MGRKSTKADKSVYQQAREEADLTRETAETLLPVLTADRIAKIESGKAAVHPEDVVLMAECYKKPSLCNYYCANECAIGKNSVPEVPSKELTQITVETLNALNRLNRVKDRFLEIAEDGTVTENEKEDFSQIKSTLDKISLSVRALQLWIDNAVASGKLPKDFIK